MIHIASDAGIRADHEQASYSVMSAGLIALAELFAAEGAPHGVRSNAVCPGEPSAVAEAALGPRRHRPPTWPRWSRGLPATSPL